MSRETYPDKNHAVTRSKVGQKEKYLASSKLNGVINGDDPCNDERKKNTKIYYTIRR